MKIHENPSLLGHMVTALGAALKRGILGKSSNDYLKREPEFEPVHGWTKRQFDDYLARNPGYRSTYNAELQKRCDAAAPEVNGSSLDWFKGE